MVRNALAKELTEDEQGGESPLARVHEDFGRRLAVLEDVLLALLSKKDVEPEDHFAIRSRVVNRRKALAKSSKESFCDKCKTGVYHEGICIYCGYEVDT